jgi:hypothetical protein
MTGWHEGLVDASVVAIMIVVPRARETSSSFRVTCLDPFRAAVSVSVFA